MNHKCRNKDKFNLDDFKMRKTTAQMTLMNNKISDLLKEEHLYTPRPRKSYLKPCKWMAI